MFKITVKNLKQIKSDLSRFNGFLTKEQIVLYNKAFPKSFYAMEKHLFKTKGASGEHGKWPKLSEKYKLRKQISHPGKPIMRRDDALYNSLTRHTENSIKFIGYIPSTKKFIINLGTNVEADGYDYPYGHQEGTAKGNKIRRTIDPTERDLLKWAKIIQETWIKNARALTHFDKKSIPLPRWDSKTNMVVSS